MFFKHAILGFTHFLRAEDSVIAVVKLCADIRFVFLSDMSTLDWGNVRTTLQCFVCGIFLQETTAPLNYPRSMMQHLHLLF